MLRIWRLVEVGVLDVWRYAVNNKKFSYTLKPATKNSTFVECRAANIAQEFLNEDVPALLNDLPELIMAEKRYDKNQSEVIRFRVSKEAKKNIERMAIKKGYPSVSEFLRDLALNEEGFDFLKDEDDSYSLKDLKRR